MLDLGLARLHDDVSERLTPFGSPMGTYDYLAPEQASDSHRADIRSDIYSLGCSLYQLLCGRAPFGGPGYRSAAEKLRAHAEDPLPPLGPIPPGLQDVIRRMAAKRPEDRYQTPAEVVAALAPFVTGNDPLSLLAQRTRAANRDGRCAASHFGNLSCRSDHLRRVEARANQAAESPPPLAGSFGHWNRVTRDVNGVVLA